MAAASVLTRAALEDAAKAAKRFIDFANETGSPYHTVSACAKLLSDAGFKELKDSEAFADADGKPLANCGKYFVTKGGADIMAFVVGGKFRTDMGKKSWDAGLSMVGAHTDSPCLRLRPNSKISSSGMLQVGIQTYGGGLWHTWFDRPLGFAGKVIVRDAKDGKLGERLVRVPDPVMLIPNLAIHLQSADERKAFNVNTESHLQPVLCSSLYEAAHEPPKPAEAEAATAEPAPASRHHAALLQMLAKALGCQASDIVDTDLCLMDSQPSNIIGLHGEFISSPRIDNLLSTWAAVQGIIEFASDKAGVESAKDISIAVSFDHEEVGSQSLTGADGDTFPTWLQRLLGGLGVDPEHRPTVFSRSFLVSADCAHGVHPNYSAKHQSEHRPELHKGIVIKANANQRYATTPLTAALLREVCSRAKVPVQDFIVRNDTPCGTTIGPIISAKTGIRTIDIGAPQWAMHSCRESCSAADTAHLLNLCKAFYQTFRDIDNATSKI